jgi:hypothetical protein
MQVHSLGCSVLAADPAGRFLLTGGQDGLLRAWPMLPRAQLQLQAQQAQAQAAPAPQTFLGHPAPLQGVALLGDAAVSVCEGGCVLVWEVALEGEAGGAAGAQEAQRAQGQQPGPGAGPTAKGWGPPLGPDGLAEQLADLGRDAGVAAPGAGGQDQWRIRAARPDSASPAPVLPPQVGGAPRCASPASRRGHLGPPAPAPKPPSPSPRLPSRRCRRAGWWA